MKTNKILSSLLYAIFLIAFTMIVSCKQKKENTDKNTTVNIDSKETDAHLKPLNLEGIPFELPENWTYRENPVQGLESLKGFAANPVKGNVTVTVWDFPVKTIDSLEVLFIKDMASTGQESSIIVKDTLIEGITLTPGTRFNWIGKTFMRNEKMRLIAVGAAASEYENNQKLIEIIFNSITEE